MSEITPVPAPQPPPIGQSARIGELVLALSKAQGDMISPRRNKKVKVKSRKGADSSYEFRYTTLDNMIDMVRPHLAENGLALINITHVANRRLYTRLLHISEQWLETECPIIVTEDGPQGFVSAVSYARRTNFATLLNIASDEDDDGNIASGNHMQEDYDYGRGSLGAPNQHTNLPRRDKVADIEMRRLQARFAALMDICNEIIDAAQDDITQDSGIRLLKAWQLEIDTFSGFRGRPEFAEPWELLQQRVPAAIERIWGDMIAQAWLEALRAETPQQVAVMRGKWSGDWAARFRGLKSQNQAAYGLICEHMTAQGKRCDRADQDKTDAAESPPEPENNPPVSTNDNPPPATGEPPPADDPPPESDGPAEDLQQTYLVALLNVHGEPTGQEFMEPMKFAGAYAELWLTQTDPELQMALEHYNADALALTAERDRRAGELLLDLNTPPISAEIMVEPLPRNSAGSIEIAVYLAALKESLKAIRVADITAWETANMPNINQLQPIGKLKALKLLCDRRAELGLPSSTAA